MTNYSPKVNLFETDETNITEIMAGPWESVRVHKLDANETMGFKTEDQEHGVFVIDGSFTAVIPEGEKFEFKADMSMTLAQGGGAVITAGPYGTRICVVTMKVGH